MINYSFLRPQKAAALKNFYNNPFEKKEKLTVETFSNAIILPLQRFESDSLLFGRGGVVNNQGIYIDSSAIPNRVQGTYNYSYCERIDEKVVYCGFFVNQWGHFLIESISRLWYFLENDPTIDHYVFFVKNGEKTNISGNYREFLQLLGVWDKLVFINEPTQYKEVVIPELSYSRMNYYSEQYKNLFKIVSLAAQTNLEESPSKIFLSRSKIKNIEKKEFGLKIIDSFFQKNGYTILHPEQLTLTELITYLGRADEIATLSGSIHHNLLFTQDNKKIVIIERSVLNNEIQVDINRMKSFDAIYVDANIPIYPVSVGVGPFIMAYNNYMKDFSHSRNYEPIDKRIQSGKTLKKFFKQYIICYHNTYGFKLYMEDWMVKYYDLLNEGYNAGMNYFGKYLSNYSILYIILSPRYWKNVILKTTFHFFESILKKIYS